MQENKKKATFVKMENRNKIPANKGISYFTKPYQNMHPLQRKKQSALDASDNGRCWWIYTFLMGNDLSLKKE